MISTRKDEYHLSSKNVKPLCFSKDAIDEDIIKSVAKLGINLGRKELFAMNEAYFACAKDADLVPTITDPSISTPVQFLQEWLPGFVQVVTAARKIDSLVGITINGRWEDEEVIQQTLEYTGEAQAYGDYTNIPLSSWNTNFERRTIVRFEEGLTVGRLEEARASAMKLSSADSKRIAAARSLEIVRNLVGFYGYNNGLNRTYGFLNEPSLPAYVTVPVGAGGNTEWSDKTFLEIVADLQPAFSALRVQSGEQVDPDTTPLILAVSTAAKDYMNTVTDFGISVTEWLNKSYPNVRVESAVELDGADGGENVFYLYAENVNGTDDDTSTDDGRTFAQVVPAKFVTLGVEQRAKSYVEDYTNATSGIYLKRPYAVYRASGI